MQQSILSRAANNLENTTPDNSLDIKNTGGIYLSVIVPAYNEGERLPKTLRRFDEYFSKEPYSYEILIVADGANSGLVGTGLRGAVGSTILRIRIKVNDLDKDYLSYFLKSKFQEFNKDMKGTGIPHLKSDKLLKLELRKPSLKAIAAAILKAASEESTS